MSLQQYVKIVSLLFIMYAIDRDTLIELQMHSFLSMCSFVLDVDVVLEWNDGLGPGWMHSWDDLHGVDLGKLHDIQDLELLEFEECVEDAVVELAEEGE
jgi:hypothetical protein